jgi:hypothetical protein
VGSLVHKPVLPFRVDRHQVAKVRRLPAADPAELRELLALAPVLARINPDGVGTTVRLMRNLIDIPELTGTEGVEIEALEAVTAQFAFFTHAAQRRPRRR